MLMERHPTFWIVIFTRTLGSASAVLHISLTAANFFARVAGEEDISHGAAK